MIWVEHHDIHREQRSTVVLAKCVDAYRESSLLSEYVDIQLKQRKTKVNIKKWKNLVQDTRHSSNNKTVK